MQDTRRSPSPHFFTYLQYHPERLLPALEGLPRPFLQERALLLSRLGRHEEVLRLYVERLKEPALAEGYCEEVCVCAGAWGWVELEMDGWMGGWKYGWVSGWM